MLGSGNRPDGSASGSQTRVSESPTASLLKWHCIKFFEHNTPKE